MTAPPSPWDLELRSVETGATVTGHLPVGGTAQLRVNEAGPYELTLETGDEVSVVPFRVLVAGGASWELLVYGGFFLAALLLVGGMLTARLGRGLSFVAALAVGMAATIVALDPLLPAPEPRGAAPVEETPGRPFVQALATTTPALPIAGQDLTLHLTLVDGATGRPVDDLVVHHEALAHVIVTSTDAGYFRHLHPRRLSPGLYEVRLRPDRGGRMLVWTELERTGSGGQLPTTTFQVHPPTTPPTPTPSSAPPSTPTPSTTASTTATPSPSTLPATAAPPLTAPPITTAPPLVVPSITTKAGTPTTIDLTEPSRPWLGMPGHLIVRDATGSFLGHVHATGRRFTFTFPRPGRYHAWVAIRRRTRA